jgi:membrane-associated phospholipid phosphatase
VETIAFLQQFASPALDALMLAITNLGDEQAYIAFLLVTYLAFEPQLGRRAGIYLLLGFYLNFHLKGLLDTPRPFALDPSVARSEAAVATAGGAGFPSGHAQGSTTFWGYLALYVRKPWFWALAVTLVVLISLSRVYLGVHIPVDIWGGLVIGALVVAAAYAVDRTLGSARAWPRLATLLVGLLVPLALHLFLPVADSELLMGGLAAFITAPVLSRHRLPAQLWQRVAVALLGLVLVFAVLFASSALLPEAVKRDAIGGFIRYLALGYTGLVLTPWLARALGLAPLADAPGR